ncbi:MAG: acyl-[acyl-carrier-protein] thioesterase [Desulfovibrionaceae bacterium]
MPEMLLEFPATIRMYEVGPDETAPLPVLLRHFQEAASIHADRLSWGKDDLTTRGLAWVLARMYLTMERFPGPWEDILVRTWPSSRDKYQAKRDFSILDAEGRTLGQGTSSWVLMDIAARRMCSIPADFDDTFANPHPSILDFPGRRVAALKEPEHEAAVLARLEDLDLNGHVNNTHFPAWALEAVPPAFEQEHRLAALDIQIRAEVRRGDKVRSLAGPGEPEQGEGGQRPVLLHSLVREADGVEVARAASTWEKK